MNWLFDMLRPYPEIAIFLALALGFWVGQMKLGTFSLRVVHQHPARGYSDRTARHHHSPAAEVGVLSDVPVRRGLRSRSAVLPRRGEGRNAAGFFAVVQCLFCLIVPVVIAKLAGYDLGYAAGLYSGSQTISAAMGSRPTPSTGWAWPPTKPRLSSITCRSLTPSPTCSAPWARRS